MKTAKRTSTGVRSLIAPLAGAVILCISSAAFADAGGVPPPAGLISWWPGDGVALDVIGTNHGTLKSGASYAEAEVGQGFSFSGSGGYVGLPNDFFPFPHTGTGTQAFTMELWFKTTSGGVILGQ